MEIPESANVRGAGNGLVEIELTASALVKCKKVLQILAKVDAPSNLMQLPWTFCPIVDELEHGGPVEARHRTLCTHRERTDWASNLYGS